MPRYSPRTGQLTEYQVGPFDSAHIYLQWGGKLPGNEQWSCGLRFAGPSGTAEADANGMLVGVAAAVVEFHQRVATAISASAKLSFVKCNGIGTNGKYIGSGTTQALYADLPGGVAGWQLHPHQIAQVVSLKTGFSRGPAHAGRFYLPLPNLNVAADGMISAADAIAQDTSATTFLADLNAVNPAWDVAIFSRKAGAPAHRTVTGVQVGRVLDTQRRRRRSLTELYSA